MERLTINISDRLARCNKVSTDYCLSHRSCFDCAQYSRIVDRLAAYEDIGLEPVKINILYHRYHKLVDGVTFDRLRELAQADCYDGDAAILETALETFGPAAQTTMVFEEMAELQKELCKHARGKDNVEAIAEEIADVLIMLEQMMILHRCSKAVQRHKEAKLERLADRIREAQKAQLSREEPTSELWKEATSAQKGADHD